MTRLARARVSPKYRLIDVLSGQSDTMTSQGNTIASQGTTLAAHGTTLAAIEPVAGTLAVTDSITEPSTVSGSAVLYVDEADGSLKVKFGSGTVKTIATNP